MIIQNKPQAESLLRTFYKIYEWAVAHNYVIHRRHEGVLAIPREKRLIVANPASGVNIFGAALLYFHSKDPGKYNWISFSTTRTLADWLEIDPSLPHGEKMLRGFINGYFSSHNSLARYVGEEFGFYSEKGYELQRFILNKDNSMAQRFADAVRDLLCANSDLVVSAEELQKVLEDYDGVKLGGYNKIVRLANEIDHQLYDKYSAADPEDELSWNFKE